MATLGIRIVVFIVSFLALQAHGASLRNDAPDDAPSPIVRDIAYEAADILEENLLFRLNKTLPILVTSLSDMDRLKSTSEFGRLMGDLIASRMVQHGYRIIEMKLNKNNRLFKTGRGILALTDDIREMETDHDAQAILTGTYALSGGHLLVSAKIIDAGDHAVISTCDLTVPLTKAIDDLAARERSRISRPNLALENSEDIPPNALTDGVITLEAANPLGASIIQQRLAELGYYKDTIDGLWGDRSRRALRGFKKDKGLPDNSRWDVPTQMALFRGTGL